MGLVFPSCRSTVLNGVKGVILRGSTRYQGEEKGFSTSTAEKFTMGNGYPVMLGG